MADLMTFPNTVEAFMDQYKITDTEQIYTNGAELVPIFRMKQWFENKPGQQWIPVKTRPMTEEERQYWEETTAIIDFEDEDAVIFDCQMPDDGQEVWVCSKNGTVSEDVCERDNDFCGLEGNGDWLDIVAWMPRIKPEPWKGEDDAKVR